MPFFPFFFFSKRNMITHRDPGKGFVSGTEAEIARQICKTLPRCDNLQWKSCDTRNGIEARWRSLLDKTGRISSKGFSARLIRLYGIFDSHEDPARSTEYTRVSLSKDGIRVYVCVCARNHEAKRERKPELKCIEREFLQILSYRQSTRYRLQHPET